MTDHRVNLTLYNLTKVMEGDVEEIIKALYDADIKERIEMMIKEAGGE
jgi:peptide chain release factor 1